MAKSSNALIAYAESILEAGDLALLYFGNQAIAVKLLDWEGNDPEIIECETANGQHLAVRIDALLGVKGIEGVGGD